MGLILGSASPRRLALLAQIGVVPDEVRPAEIDETPAKGELPRAYVERMAREKAEAIAAGPDDLILTADTEVSAGRRILGKPADEAEAVQFLLLLSGRRHRVTTAICLKLADRVWLAWSYTCGNRPEYGVPGRDLRSMPSWCQSIRSGTSWEPGASVA